MGKGSKSVSHQLFKDKAKTRVDDIQGMFSDLQSARKENRNADVAVLEEQVHQMLREWKAELNEASPANSLQGNSQASSDFFSETLRLLQLSELEDDATSKLAELAFGNPPKPEQTEVPQSDVAGTQGGGNAIYQDNYYANQELSGQEYLYVDQYECNLPAGPCDNVVNCLEGATHYNQYDIHQEMATNLYFNMDSTDHNGDVLPRVSDLLSTIYPPASAFFGPKCVLWDCQRPAQGSDCCQDYCSSFHGNLALNEGPPGMTPVLCPGGIDLKDGPLFAALSAKTQGKSVGIPVCEGAATAKSPWNAPELFDLSVLEGESIREWLFFDKPRRAFESGNRKQRSLPDYSGRGWHESRKQVMKEFGGLKRSYYMDPQPLIQYEWHMYEYGINDSDAFALYRLEFKLVDPKKTPKAKINSNSLAQLQQQLGRLNSENSADNNKGTRSRTKVNNQNTASKIYSTSEVANQNKNANLFQASDLANANLFQASDQVTYLNENPAYGPSNPYVYSIGSLKDKYAT